MDSALVDVAQADCGFAEAPDRIGSSGMGPCIAAAVLNHTAGKAWVCHESGWSVNSALLDEMLDEARAASHQTDEITLWLIGGCINDDQEADVVEMTRADRSIAHERARQRFSAATIKTNFSDDPGVMSISVGFEYDGRRWVEAISLDRW